MVDLSARAVKKLDYSREALIEARREWESTGDATSLVIAALPRIGRRLNCMATGGISSFQDDVVNDAACWILEHLDSVTPDTTDDEFEATVLAGVENGCRRAITRYTRQLASVPAPHDGAGWVFRDEGSIYMTELRMLLEELPAALERALYRNSRVRDPSFMTAARFTLSTMLDGKVPSLTVLFNRFGVVNPYFVFSWCLTFYRRFIASIGLLFLDERYEFGLATL